MTVENFCFMTLEKCLFYDHWWIFYKNAGIPPPPHKNSVVRQKMGGKSLKLTILNSIFTLISYISKIFS